MADTAIHSWETKNLTTYQAVSRSINSHTAKNVKMTNKYETRITNYHLYNTLG